jgi:hypothetical protein
LLVIAGTCVMFSAGNREDMHGTILQFIKI